MWEQAFPMALRDSDPVDFRQDPELAVHHAVLRARSYHATKIDGSAMGDVRLHESCTIEKSDIASGSL